MNPQEQKDFGLPTSTNFEPIKDDNKATKLAAISAIFIVFGFIVYWFYLRKPDVSELEESLGLEKNIEVEDIIEEVIIEKFDTPKNGEIVMVNSASAKYYTIVGSFIDRDLAMDYAKKLAKSDICVYLIPNKGIYCYVAVEQSDSIDNAREIAKNLHPKYKGGTWVLRY